MLNSRYETPYTLMVTPVLKRRSRAPLLVPGFCILFHSRAVQVGRAMLLFSDLEPRGHVGLAGRSAYAIPCECIAPLGRVSWIVPIILSVPDNPYHREICSPCTLYTNPHYPQKYRILRPERHCPPHVHSEQDRAGTIHPLQEDGAHPLSSPV